MPNQTWANARRTQVEAIEKFIAGKDKPEPSGQAFYRQNLNVPQKVGVSDGYYNLMVVRNNLPSWHVGQSAGRADFGPIRIQDRSRGGAWREVAVVTIDRLFPPV